MTSSSLLKEIFFFKNFTPLELGQIEKITDRKKYLSNQIVFKEGEEASKMYLVEVGTVRISKNSPSAYLITIGKGGTFGEMPFLDGGKRSATASALEETHLIEIPYTKLANLLLNYPETALKFYTVAAKYVSKRLRATTEDLEKAKEFLHRHY